jgi:hypothetical protein
LTSPASRDVRYDSRRISAGGSARPRSSCAVLHTAAVQWMALKYGSYWCTTSRSANRSRVALMR